MFPFKMTRAATQPRNPEACFPDPRTPTRNPKPHPFKGSKTPVFSLDTRLQILESKRKKDTFPYSFSYTQPAKRQNAPAWY